MPLLPAAVAPVTLILSIPTLSVTTAVNLTVADLLDVFTVTVALLTLNELIVGACVSVFDTDALTVPLLPLPPLSLALSVIVSVDVPKAKSSYS